MATEGAGRSGKLGDRYEFRWAVYQIIQLIKEKISSIEIESIGEDEKGTDIWIYNLDGTREQQQLKIRNASNPNWTIRSAEYQNIVSTWKYHLDRDAKNKVSLVSPVYFIDMEDLIFRANNSNENAEDFYKYQIKSSTKTTKIFQDYCKIMGLDWNKKEDLEKSKEYLSRTQIHNYPESDLKKYIKDSIDLLFIGEVETIYDAFISYIADNDVWGRKIDLLEINDLLTKRKIVRKDLSNDKSILPRIETLNFEYSNSFRSINNQLLICDKLEECINNIEKDNSIIIHGRSGIGKSGCTEGIIKYCKENKIPYIALKLDKRTPKISANKWGEELGLSSSIAHCLNAISNEKKSVIILDQLDALRWTQTHSREALDVCIELIKQVENINEERTNKIVIIFVCRKHDLENDNKIKSLFEKNVSKISWKKVAINEFDNEVVEKIVGNNYKKFSSKLRELLKLPSNLYIWTQLANKENYNDISTTSHLIDQWWKEIKQKGVDNGLSETEIELTKDRIIDFFVNNNKLEINKRLVSISFNSLHHLITIGIIIEHDDKISFFHQSLVDYFISIKMVNEYINNKDILKLRDSLGNQFPTQRYQLQLFFQNILEIDEDFFIEAGKNILDEAKIRFYLKYVLFEVLGQIEEPSNKILCFVKELYNSKYKKSIINTILMNHRPYINAYLLNNQLENWYKEDKNIIIELLVSIKPNYSKETAKFIRDKMFKEKETDMNLYRCFSYDINEDTDEMFELRMDYYKKYPELSYDYINFKKMLQECEMRTIRLLDFWLNNDEYKKNNNNIYKYEEELLEEDDEIFIKNNRGVIDILLKNIPFEVEEYGNTSEWYACNTYKNGIERVCVEIIKKANKSLINNNPDEFIEIYNKYMGKGYEVFNEIILDGMLQFPTEKSDYVINYLISDFDSNIFDETSKNKDKLFLAKQIILKFSDNCSKDIFKKLEKTIVEYKPNNMLTKYKDRYNYNKGNKQKRYNNFWGDLQYELIQVLPKNKLSKSTNELLEVLKRKFPTGTHKYIHFYSHFGTVHSPIEGKKLSDAQWKKIICNTKIKSNRSSHIEVKDGFIENSIYEFSASFNIAVSNEPLRMINLVLNCDSKIVDQFYNSLLNGIICSEKINDVPNVLIEKVLEKIGTNYESEIERDICCLIERKEDKNWSTNTLTRLKNIATSTTDPILEQLSESKYTNREESSTDKLHSDALNCLRGNAALAIKKILYYKKELYPFFKETAEIMYCDENPVIKFASLYLLTQIYEIDEEFAENKILELYEYDERFLTFNHARYYLHRLYKNNQKRVVDLVEKNINSSHELVSEVCLYTMAEFFIRYNEFKEIFDNLNALEEKQIESILTKLTYYFEDEKYNEIIKEIFLKIKSSNLQMEHPISKLFYDKSIDLERDEDFIIKIMKNPAGRRSTQAFINYLRNQNENIIKYSNVILEIARDFISNIDDNTQIDMMWVADDITELILQLFDESININNENTNLICNSCLEIWDIMYEKDIGSIRTLSKELSER